METEQGKERFPFFPSFLVFDLFSHHLISLVEKYQVLDFFRPLYEKQCLVSHQERRGFAISL